MVLMRVLVLSGAKSGFFFFQAEDGIRDYKVTGVQTCALPIYTNPKPGNHPWLETPSARVATTGRQGGVVMQKLTSILILITGLVCLSPWASYAQEVSAGITGRVSDPSGSAIVGATVTAKDLDRGTEWPTTTNMDGIYAFPRIPVGTYSLKIEAKGFKTFMQASLTLEV